MASTVTLHCETGNHEWERVSQRGRKPHNCPEHRPVVVADKAVPENEQGSEEKPVKVVSASMTAEERIDNLMRNLRANGSSLEQNKDKW